MGSCYVNKVEGRQSPSVALANNGAEESKGTPMLKEAHQLLKTTPGIRFVGNIEPRDVPNGEVDVVVCDGFTGNVILKLTEGVAKMLLGMLKQMFLANFGGKIAYLLLKGGVSDLKHQMDSEEYGGAPFLGAKQPVIKAHAPPRPRASRTPSGRPRPAWRTTCAAPCSLPWMSLRRQTNRRNKKHNAREQ